MRLASIVGARPNFVKLAAVHAAIRSFSDHIIIHTGQHYDYRLSEIFFKELDLPEPDFNLEVGSGSPGVQIGNMLKKLQPILGKGNKYDCALVYGDTNSTFAGALSASKSGIRVAHVEAGLRSFDRRMPEETNRILTDHLSDYLFCPTIAALNNLRREHVNGKIMRTGDLSVEIVRNVVEKLVPNSTILDCLGLNGQEGEYILMTIHRAENTNSLESLESVIHACEILSKREDFKIVFPIHPRTAHFLKRVKLYTRLRECRNVMVVKPTGFIDFIALLLNSKKVVTDSGGLQKEAFLLGIPCVTLRENTEWVETIQEGANILTGTHTNLIVKAVSKWIPRNLNFSRKPIFGKGNAADLIKLCLEKELSSR
jgi:UDP-N-acetylglucosamine 2-epimerase (non-hydrolysing)